MASSSSKCMASSSSKICKTWLRSRCVSHSPQRSASVASSTSAQSKNERKRAFRTIIAQEISTSAQPENESSRAFPATIVEEISTSAQPENESSRAFPAPIVEEGSPPAQPENESRRAFRGMIAGEGTPSKRSHKRRYNVFINHRGPDVKETLATDLYDILKPDSVFLDSKEFEYGDPIPETIADAMDGALVHIAIFSPGYADSAWCLAELAYMIQSGAKIIPIFYHVDPSDLRRIDEVQGVYAEAFERHKQKYRYSSEQLQEWKAALEQVSYYHGQIVKSDEDEKRLLKNIARCVQKAINDSVPFTIAKNIVRMKEQVVGFFEWAKEMLKL